MLDIKKASAVHNLAHFRPKMHISDQKTLQNLDENKQKPTLLLHACCGPCFTIPYELIKGHFDITIIYNNSNIYPKEEYLRRLEEFKRYIKEINADVKFIEFP